MLGIKARSANHENTSIHALDDGSSAGRKKLEIYLETVTTIYLFCVISL